MLWHDSVMDASIPAPVVDDMVTWELSRDIRPQTMRGNMKPSQVRDGVARGPFGLRQRRVRARVLGEPQYEAELVPANICEARPHVLAWVGWHLLMDPARQEPDLDITQLDIYSAYRSVALQKQIWTYRLDERRQMRQAEGLAPLSLRELERQQQKWTAKPGQSAHHTGFAIDMMLYHQGKTASLRSPEYAWLARHAARFGFYPYMPEAWHWEFNPPGLTVNLEAFRDDLAAQKDPRDALRRCIEALWATDS